MLGRSWARLIGARTQQSFTQQIQLNGFVLSRGFALAKDPYEALDGNPNDAQRIQEFLTKYKLEKYADKFKSWEHLMDTKREVLKHVMEIPCKDRKKIRAKVQEWKINQYFKTGEIYQSTLPITRTIVEDPSSSEDDLAVSVPTPQGLMQTYVNYPGATRREPHPIVEKMSSESYVTLLSEDEESPISLAAAKRADEFE